MNTPNQKPNWYAKLHQTANPIGAPSNKKGRLNLSIFFRIWLAVAIIIVIASVVVFDQLFERVEPTSKQVIEDTLVDTGKLLSASFMQPLQSGKLANASYQKQLDKAFANTATNPINPISPINRELQKSLANKQNLAQLNTWFNTKTHSSFRVYVTNSKGKVIYDSLSGSGNAEGQDYSRWNDVYLTLRGKYGARSTRADKENAHTTVMYVAQPITDNNGKIIGVVSVGKPVATILPYIDAARQQMLTTSLSIMVLSILFAGLVAWWLQQSIAMVTRYTRSLATTQAKPSFYLGSELNELTDTIEEMKHKLENKAYVTDYVHTLTHELKSPLTAIKASGELLADTDLDEDDRLLLSQTISEQSTKLQSLIDRLLLLAKIEQPNFKLDTRPVNILKLVQSVVGNHQPRISKHQININYLYNNSPVDIDNFSSYTQMVNADEFWLTQALDNLLSNAIHFADSNIFIRITDSESKKCILTIINDGIPIPTYALNKIFDRYFSLSHQASHAKNTPQTNHKGSGLGLTLTKQVIEHHGGQISIKNISHNGKPCVQASVTLPAKQLNKRSIN